MLENHAQMARLARLHDVLVPLMQGHPLHYLDVPFYANVGDLLIMKGTLAFFEKQSLRVKQYGMYFNYSSRWAKSGDVIVFQGGGNFGDIYGPFQAFRERIVSELPNNRIIILPQSFHFADPANFERCKKIFSNHPDLHICVRDTESQFMARQLTPNVYLLPDMAHNLYPLKVPFSNPRRDDPDPLYFVRKDNEKGNLKEIPAGAEVKDWDDVVGTGWRFFLAEIAERCMFHATRLGMNRPFANLQARLWIWQANRFVDRAVRLFGSARSVVTDRLHGHILCCLITKANTVYDNSYGKNTRYMRCWTQPIKIQKAA